MKTYTGKARTWLLTTAMMAAALTTTSTTTYAQQIQASRAHFSTDDGLKSNAVSDIIRDDYGYIWIATWNGLSRFDGFNFYNYSTGNRSGVPLLHNRIVDLKTDLSQNIWMRMYDGCIFVLNRSTDKIENALKDIPGYKNFKTAHRLTVTSNGDVLAIINGIGIYRMRLENGKMRIMQISTGKMKATSIAEGYKGDVWVGTDNGIHRLNANDENLTRSGVFEGETIKCMYSNGFNIYAGTSSGKIVTFAYGQEPKIIKETGESINNVFVDSHNTLWFTTRKHGVSRLNLETGDVKEFTQTVLVPEYDVNGSRIAEVNHTVWVAMTHGGFGYYNRETDEMEYFHNDPANPWNLSNTVAAFLALPEGVVFESTSNKGLEKLDLLKNTIRHIHLFDNAEANSENEVRALYYDKQTRRLLVGNKKGTLLFYNSMGSRTEMNGDGNGNSFGRIYGIDKDSKGNYWISSKGQGLIRLTPSGGSFHTSFFKPDRHDPMSISSDQVYSSVEDKDGNIWVATYGGGVNILTRQKDGRLVFLNSGNVMQHYPYDAYQKVRALVVDKDGNVWAGTTDGLLIMSYRNNKVNIQRISESPNGLRDLNSRDIVCLACDAKGTIWIGTNGGGLSRTTGYDENGNRTFETFGYKDGLPSEEIKSITFDESGNIWFSTDHVLCSLTPEQHILSTFSVLDGVDGTLCSEAAAVALPGGNLAFGTIKGFYFVDRKLLTNTNGSMLKLKITDFYINDKLVSPRLDSTLTYYVPDSKEVTLPSNDAAFAFRFASLNYQLQQRVHYQYMLEGHDKNWINAGKDRMATYSDVSAGTYTFKVKAFLIESPDKYDMRTITVIVPPHFLLSSNAVWIYIVLLAIILSTIMFMRQKKLAQRFKAGKANDEKPEAEDN